ncbi:hypothetical protein KSS87_000247 [Heliosperma pusillum]|nr:hypothetical protein KSS87_000247 [Heliosperma pusillum]
MEMVTLKMWHGGIFRKTPKLSYVGGEFKLYEKIEVDKLCFFWLREMAEECGKYSKIDEIYYLVPLLSLDKGIRKVYDDKEVLEMAKYLTLHGIIELFVLHGVDEPDVLHGVDEPEISREPFQTEQDSTTYIRKKLSPKRNLYNSSAFEKSKVATPGITSSKVDDWIGHRPESSIKLKDPVEQVEDSDDAEYEVNEAYMGDEESDCKNELDDLVSDNALVDQNVNTTEVNEEELTDSTLGSDSDTDDEEFRAAKESLNKWKENVRYIALQLQKEAEEGKKPMRRNEVNNGEGEDEVLRLTQGECEEDDILRKMRGSGILVNELTDLSKIQWKAGMRFENRKTFRDCVTRYAILQGRHLTFRISDNNRQQRLGVVCKEGCPFRLYASWDSTGSSFVVKSVDGIHKCSSDMESNKQMKSTWLAEQFFEVFKGRPHWPASEIVETARRAYNVIINKSFAYKVKYLAHRKLHESMKDHYSKLGRYMEAIKQLNPDSCFKLETDPPRELGPPIFKRLFVCFDALSTGWLIGCRRVICLDGCFLKTFLGGVLLAAIGRDANDQMFPIAYAVVEGENNESWNWFLLELRQCLKKTNEGNQWTFISDQQKGILSAVANVFGKAEHRNCARHVFANWQKTYQGDEYKGLFWRAARAYNEADYVDAMEEMESLNPIAALSFKAQNPKTFCRSFVSTNTRCDVIVNNMAETFNGYIINARTKHLLDLLEEIRTALMQRLAKKKAEIEKSDSFLCPRIAARLEKEKQEMGNCNPMRSSDTEFQVIHKLDKLYVDLQEKTCTCRKWQLTGIPCCHAIACIYFKGLEVEPFVDECYLRVTNLKAYSKTIKPCVGERHWPIVDMELDPPQIKIGPRRPTKNRRKEPHEDPKKPGRLTKHGTTIRCSVCKSEKHNKRKCPDKDKVVELEPQPKKGRGRPRKAWVV